jgi:hypothetical protein
MRVGDHFPRTIIQTSEPLFLLTEATMRKHPNSPEPKGAERPDPTPRKPRVEEEDESLDRTIEDSFPASDPPSSIPDPHEDEDAA